MFWRANANAHRADAAGGMWGVVVVVGGPSHDRPHPSSSTYISAGRPASGVLCSFHCVKRTASVCDCDALSLTQQTQILRMATQVDYDIICAGECVCVCVCGCESKDPNRTFAHTHATTTTTSDADAVDVVVVSSEHDDGFHTPHIMSVVVIRTVFVFFSSDAFARWATGL